MHEIRTLVGHALCTEITNSCSSGCLACYYLSAWPLLSICWSFISLHLSMVYPLAFPLHLAKLQNHLAAKMFLYVPLGPSAAPWQQVFTLSDNFTAPVKTSKTQLALLPQCYSITLPPSPLTSISTADDIPHITYQRKPLSCPLLLSP